MPNPHDDPRWDTWVAQGLTEDQMRDRMPNPITHAQKQRLPAADELDGYARDGVALSRDAAHIVISVLWQAAANMRDRGGAANERAAAEREALAQAISKALR